VTIDVSWNKKMARYQAGSLSVVENGGAKDVKL
jgi:hypothetical protein